MGRYDRYDDEEDEDFDVRRSRRQPNRFEQPHAVAGFVSLGLGVIAGVAGICTVVIAVALEVNNVGPGPGPDDVWTKLLGVLILGCGVLALAGFVLGLVTSLQADRNPLFAILGTVLDGIEVLGITVLICMGLLFG